MELTVGNRGEVPTLFPLLKVYHLAAKKLIKDWQSGKGIKGVSDRERKKFIIKLSMDSSVISSRTAYVAIGEIQGKPIEGAMKTWDLTATEFGFCRGSRMIQLCMSPPIPASVMSVSYRAAPPLSACKSKISFLAPTSLLPETEYLSFAPPPPLTVL